MNAFIRLIREWSGLDENEIGGETEAAIRRHQNRRDLFDFVDRQKDRLQEWIDDTPPAGFRIGDRILHVEWVNIHPRLNSQTFPLVTIRVSESAEREIGRTIASCELTPETTVADLTGFEFEQLQKEVIGVLLEMHQREAALIKSMYDSMIGKPKEMCGP